MSSLLDLATLHMKALSTGEWLSKVSPLVAGKRSRILKKWYQLQLDNIDDLATILTTEQGKPLAEAKGEIRYGASFVEWFAEEAKRVYGDVIPGHGRDKRITVTNNLSVLSVRLPHGIFRAL